MKIVSKIEFQGDDLYIHYFQKGDANKFVKNRILVVSWRANKNLVNFLNNMFQDIVNKYLDEDKTEIDWEGFETEIKRYEKNQGEKK